MDFKLNLEADRRPLVPTEGPALDRAIALGNRARGAYGRAQAAYGGKAASAFAAAKARARDAGRNNIAKVRAFKQRWSGWLEKQNTNFWLLISNVLYIAVSLTTLILTLLVMNEHVGDFRRNEFTKHVDQNDGSVAQYNPCGMPTPDAMYLLQSIGALPAAGWDGASLEPDYKKWMQSVDRALCSRIVPGKELPVFDANLMMCLDTGLDNDYGVEYAEELLAFGYLMDDDTIAPTLDDFSDPSAIAKKAEHFEARACLENKQAATATEPELKPFYTKQQRDAYGDLKTRVARAYLAAMPAFARYLNNRDGCQVGENYEDPFDVMCKHSCHIRKELYYAALDQHAMYDTTINNLPPTTTFTKQLYRLLALSLAGYYDRYHNQGACFINKVLTNADTADPALIGTRDTAMNFCGDSMRKYATSGGTDPGAVESFNTKEAVGKYTEQNEKLERDEQCTITGHHPPPPAPPIHRNEPEDGSKGVNDNLASQVCAATLQYGLFEQGRLFGIPDVIAPFVVDNRVDRGLHFIGQWIYDAMYVNPVKKAGDILTDPKAKLEMYIAYRLSSTSIWAILVANVAGYMLIRAAAPTGVWVLKILGVTTNVRQPWAGRTAEYEPIRLVRPQFGWPLYLAQFTNLLVIYWIFWIDPATQSHYYITTECDDWAGLGVHVPSGAYVTSWGKRRFGRFGEHVIGILLVFTFLFVLFQLAIGKAMVDPELVKQTNQVRVGATKRMDKVALIMIGFALVIQILFIAQSIVSGDDWYQAIKASANDHAMLVTFSKDVLMSVWAAFWTSASIAWYRQKWAVDKLPAPFQFAWMAASVVLLWMPVFHSGAYLADEIDVAFTNGKGTEDTPRLIIYIMIYAFSGIWTAVLAVRLWAMFKAIPKKVTARGSVADEKRRVNAIISEAEKAKAEEERLGMYDFITSAPASKLKFDLQGMQVPAASTTVVPQRKTDAVYMPLMPR